MSKGGEPTTKKKESGTAQAKDSALHKTVQNVHMKDYQTHPSKEKRESSPTDKEPFNLADTTNVLGSKLPIM